MKFAVAISVAAAIAGAAGNRADDVWPVPRPSFAEPLPFAPKSDPEPISAEQTLIIMRASEDAQKAQESSKPSPGPAPLRPLWTWPPWLQWSWASGSPIVSWTWEPAPEPELPETTKVASTIVLTMAPGEKLPPWLQNVSSVTIAAISPPPWPRVSAPDFRIPTGRSRFARENDVEPPQQFVRWSDRLENVLSNAREVARRCRATGVKSPPGAVILGCAHRVADRCFITRIDDPGVARHELAHCNGWKHPPKAY
jgi:hypothetical protein